jgi:asparagine synthase (glutamine-hydrolysing)
VCGVFGFLALGGSSVPAPELLGRMARTLHHRGPDEGGVFWNGLVGLGSRRLSIVDLRTGRQPLENETGEVQLVCNGEIYNAPDLARGLEGRHRFRTRSDAETLLHLYEDRANDFLSRVEGMFVLALWDQAKQRLILARDRAGEKPLFYTTYKGVFYFASEISALRQVDGVGSELEPHGLRLYLDLGYFPPPWSPYRGIFKLEPGTMIVLDQRSSSPRLHNYWSLRPHALAGATSTELPGDETEAACRLREMVESSVRRQRMGDVPAGVALSGGIDSAWIAAAASSQWKETLRTFTVSFSDRSYDEGTFAARTAHWLGSVHHVVSADRSALCGALDSLAEHLDEPLGDPAVLPTFLLAKEARKHVKVLLGGEGADELFGGYPTYLGHLLANRYRQLPRWLRTRILRPMVEAWPSSEHKVTLEFLLKRFVRGADRSLLGRHRAWFGAIPPEEANLLPGPLLMEASQTTDSTAVLQHLLGDETEWGEAELEKVLYLDFRTYLGEGLLTKLDRVSMACSLESRSPYLSREIMEFAASLPLRWKVKGLDTKRIVRQAVRDQVPPELRRRKKRGLSVPLAGMFRAELRELLLAELDPHRLDREGLLDGRTVAGMMADHQSRRANHARSLWTLLSLVMWYRKQAVGRTREAKADLLGDDDRLAYARQSTGEQGVVVELPPSDKR